MHKSNLKAILTTLIGTGIVSGLSTLPVRANENTSIQSQNKAEISFSQSDYSDRPINNETSDSVKNLVGLTGLAIGTGVVGYYVSKTYKPSVANSLPYLNGKNTTLLTRVSPKLRRELLRLVHDQQTANRLLSGTFNSHPERSVNWVAEKVIYDLKRDR